MKKFNKKIMFSGMGAITAASTLAVTLPLTITTSTASPAVDAVADVATVQRENITSAAVRKITVFYHVNGGLYPTKDFEILENGASFSASARHGDPEMLFTGWMLHPTAQEALPNAGNFLEDGITLYARWERKSVSKPISKSLYIVFDAESGQVAGPSVLIRNPWQTFSLPPAYHSVTGKSAIGWSFTKNGPVQYRTGEEVILDGGFATTTKLYAIWQ